MEGNGQSRVERGDRALAIYHVVYEHEGFEESARTLFKLVHKAERQHPGKRRELYLDIEGHRNSEGGFDADMFELQEVFLVGFLSLYLSKIHAPLVKAKNPNPQDNEIPPTLVIQDKPEDKA